MNTSDPDHHPIVLEPYSIQWKKDFETESSSLRNLLESLQPDIEHIGSTAIPDMPAKPVIDIMLGIDCLEDIMTFRTLLEQKGYSYESKYEAIVPHRRFFQKCSRKIVTHHLHVVERRSDFWRDKILFRDYLIEHPEEARAYLELKEELAGTFRSRMEYSEAKGSFVHRILRLALNTPMGGKRSES